MMDQIEQARLNQLERCVPDIWDSKKALYVGIGEYRHHFIEKIIENIPIIDVVDNVLDNCVWAGIQYHKYLNEISNGDIRDFPFKEVAPDEYVYDLILWSHGPSCLHKNAAISTIEKLENRCTKLMILLTPWGAAGGTGNVSVWHRGDFEKLGYQTDTLGNKDERNSNLLAWKYIK